MPSVATDFSYKHSVLQLLSYTNLMWEKYVFVGASWEASPFVRPSRAELAVPESVVGVKIIIPLSDLCFTGTTPVLTVMLTPFHINWHCLVRALV